MVEAWGRRARGSLRAQRTRALGSANADLGGNVDGAKVDRVDGHECVRIGVDVSPQSAVIDLCSETVCAAVQAERRVRVLGLGHALGDLGVRGRIVVAESHNCPQGVLPRRLRDGVVTQLDDGHQLEPRPLTTVMAIPPEPSRQSAMATAT